MSICFDANPLGPEFAAGGNRLCGPSEFRERNSRCLRIGLLNNMPDAALKATERQFLTLLDAASDGFLVRVSLHSLPGVPRHDGALRHVEQFYSTTNLWNIHLDGLIVTGREPLSPNLRDEPYWANLTQTLDWAEENTQATVWSCLAAHAAVLHTDGIIRRKSPAKHWGLFSCEQIQNHQLTSGMPLQFSVPHSRWNSVAETDLADCGYQVLTRAADAGVDTFVKRRKSLSVFFQGHPEYDADALLLEYRRDVRRFLAGESDTYPSLPKNYFPNLVAAALNELAAKGSRNLTEQMLADVDRVLQAGRISRTWSAIATRLYRNWLDFIARQKDDRLRSPSLLPKPEVSRKFAAGLG